MSAPLQSSARDRAIASIQEAQRLIGQVDLEHEDQGAKPKTRDEPQDLSDAHGQPKKSLFAKLMSWPLIGLLVCIGVIVLAWQPNHGQVAPDFLSTSSVSVKKKEEPPKQPTARGSDMAGSQTMAASQSQAQAAPQITPIAPVASPITPELTRQFQDIANQLANIAQGIDQLSAKQSQMVTENSELAAQLKATREIARRNAELNEDLKATQAETAHQISGLVDKLKASQDVIATITEQLKETEEQVTRLVASEQKRSVRKPAPKPSAPLPGARPLDQSRLQPAQHQSPRSAN